MATHWILKLCLRRIDFGPGSEISVVVVAFAAAVSSSDVFGNFPAVAS